MNSDSNKLLLAFKHRKVLNKSVEYFGFSK